MKFKDKNIYEVYGQVYIYEVYRQVYIYEVHRHAYMHMKFIDKHGDYR